MKTLKNWAILSCLASVGIWAAGCGETATPTTPEPNAPSIEPEDGSHSHDGDEHHDEEGHEGEEHAHEGEGGGETAPEPAPEGNGETSDAEGSKPADGEKPAAKGAGSNLVFGEGDL